MTGYTVHTGSSVKFSEGWDQIFSGASKGSAKKSSAKKGTAKRAPAKAAKKAAAKGRRKA